MLTFPRVLIASAYGRGHWMAVALQEAGFNVQLIDVTPRLGKTLPADQEGPFGAFASPRWQGLENQALESFGTLEAQPYGYTLWLKSGPWEMRGPSSLYRSEALRQDPVVREFIESGSDPQLENRGKPAHALRDLNFDERWSASFASDLLSNSSQWPNRAFQERIPTGLFEKHLTRCPESFSLEQSLQWCSQKGVIVVSNGTIPDIAIERGRVQGLEVQAEKSGFVRCHHLVWMLTSMETAVLAPRIHLKLFKGESMTPEWCWQRYKIRFSPSKEAQQLPAAFALIDELKIPWTHENLVLFRKSQDPLCYHVWMRLPFSQRFHREYLQERWQPVMQSLRERCSRLVAELVGLPPEADGDGNTVAPPMYPLYHREALAHSPGLSFYNLWHSHPERWPSYSWEAVFGTQRQMIADMQRRWGDLSEEEKQKELQL